MKAETPKGAICGGSHMNRKWTRKEVIEHMKPDYSCIDCCAGVPFKSCRKGYIWSL
jgi:hypothetical protein